MYDNMIYDNVILYDGVFLFIYLYMFFKCIELKIFNFYIVFVLIDLVFLYFLKIDKCCWVKNNKNLFKLKSLIFFLYIGIFLKKFVKIVDMK